MGKKHTNTIAVDIGGNTVDLPPGSKITVVYMGTVGDDEWIHESGTTISDRAYKLAPITLHAGATEVDAALWADHVAAKSPGLVDLDGRGCLEVYRSPAAVLTRPVAYIRKVVAVTRHGRVLRAWEASEASRDEPRRRIIDGIRERVRIFGDYAPPTMLPMSGLAPIRTVEAQPSA
jgi:hypothetical protein